MKNPFKKQPEPTIKQYTQWAIFVKYVYKHGYQLKELTK